MLHWLLHWLAVHTGTVNEPGPYYGFFSGFGSIIIPPLITLAGVGLLWAWHNQCGVHRCYWPTTKKTAANERACWRHHPHPKRTIQDLHDAHHAVLRLRRHPRNDIEEST